MTIAERMNWKMTREEYAKSKGITRLIDAGNLKDELDEEYKEFIDLIVDTTREDIRKVKDSEQRQKKSRRRKR